MGHSKDQDVVRKIRSIAYRMRRNILDMALQAGAHSSHLGGGLSIVDITATLYGEIMRYESSNPQWSERDRFILSKGHGVLGYYTALAEVGYLEKEELLSFEQANTDLCGHPLINKNKGIEFSNGSLGMGLSLGIGVAKAAKYRDLSYRTFVLMGDGECNEGSVWEALMAAAQFKLDNLVLIIDRNRYQQTGENSHIMDLGDVAEKLSSFGWEVTEVDGHDVSQLLTAFRASDLADKPFAVVANTIKGKGFSFSENNNDWHHAILTKANFEQALLELEESSINE